MRKVLGGVAALWGQTVRLARSVQGRWRRRSLSRAFEEALVALGERMYAAGIDDGNQGAQIAALGQHIRQGHPARAEVEALSAERRKLLVRLAAARPRHLGGNSMIHPCTARTFLLAVAAV